MPSYLLSEAVAIGRYHVSSSSTSTNILYVFGFQVGCYTVRHRIKWDVIRVIWIGFYKNTDNDDCKFDCVGKDTIMYMLQFLGTCPSMLHMSKEQKNYVWV